jgi:hypothetical protein
MIVNIQSMRLFSWQGKLIIKFLKQPFMEDDNGDIYILCYLCRRHCRCNK